MVSQRVKEYVVEYRIDGIWIVYPEGHSFDFAFSEDAARNFALNYPNTWVRMFSVDDGDEEFEIAYQVFQDNPKHPEKSGLYVSEERGWYPYEG